MKKYTVIYQKNQKIHKEKVILRLGETVYEIEKRFENIIHIKEHQPLRWEIQTPYRTRQEIYHGLLQISTMVEAGLTIIQAIDIVSEKKGDKTFLKILSILKDSIIQGIPLQTSLEAYQQYLGKGTLVFLQLGLQNSNIKESLRALVHILQSEKEAKKQILQSLRYPFLLLFSMFIALWMVFIYVLPNFEFVFQKLQGNLPLATEVLLGLDYSMRHYWIFILGLIGGGVVILISLYKRYRYRCEKIILTHLPYLSRLLQSYYFYKLFLAMGVIVKSKFQFQIALENTQELIDNSYIQTLLQKLLADVKSGYRISDAFGKYKEFDPLVVKLLLTAETTSYYETILQDITLFYKERFEKDMKNFESFFEPLMVVFIALLVLWLILAIMVPIWDMGSMAL